MFVSTGCTGLYGITTVMAGFVILRGFFFATWIPQKKIPTSHCLGSHVFQPHSEKRNHRTAAKHSIVSCSQAHAVIIVDTQAAAALVGYCSSDVSQEAERQTDTFYLSDCMA